MSFRAGEIAGAYKIISPIGSGGVGRVFKAEHTITGRIDALKVLAAGQPGGREQAERFLREIRIQASLDHPNIARVYNAFWEGGELVMAMEFVEGESLRRILEQGRLAINTALDYSCQALSALAEAHEHHVTHRDITPANILVTESGKVKLTDFGLAKAPTDVQLTQSGAVIGSLYYMAPEQVQARPQLDSRADLYSMGAVLYEMVTGLRPFEGDSAFAIMSAQVGQAPRAPAEIEPALPPGLNDIILKALGKDPAARFQSAREFRAALESVRDVTASKSAAPRKAWAWAAAAVALALVLGFLARPAKRPPAVLPPASALAAPASREIKSAARPSAPRKTLTIHPGARVWSVALSPSGKWLAAGAEDRSIEIWDAEAGKRHAVLRGHSAGVSAVGFSRDEKWLVSGSADRTAKLWDIHTGGVRRVFRQGAMVTAVALAADGHWLACGSSDRRVKLWNVDVGDSPDNFREKSEPRALAFHPDGRVLAIGAGNSVRLWRVDTRREVQSMYRPAAALAFTSNGHCLALTAAPLQMTLWDTTMGRALTDFVSHAAVRSMAISQNGRLVAIAEEGGAILIWTVEQ